MIWYIVAKMATANGNNLHTLQLLKVSINMHISHVQGGPVFYKHLQVCIYQNKPQGCRQFKNNLKKKDSQLKIGKQNI